ncbi:MAG: hypothetical protein E6J32_09405 [Chloroflexi bacterium]|nr:MAG: hypothetical protein E6J32_09405 [Chloroflexota bacterium]
MPISNGTVAVLISSHIVQDLKGGDVTEAALQVATDRHQRGRADHGEAQPDERAARRRSGERGQYLTDDQGGQNAEGGVKDRARDRDQEQAAMAAGDCQHA